MNGEQFMSKKQTPSDECISNEAIERIHNAMIRSGTKELLTDLYDRETALGAYVIFCGHHISETVRISGAPASLVAWVKESVMVHALVCIEAQREAHYSLWREFMGDFTPDDSSENPNQESKEDDHGR